MRPWPAGGPQLGYALALVVTLGGSAPPLWTTRIPSAPSTVLCLPDESQALLADPARAFAGLAQRVQPLSLDLPASAAPYHYRLVTAIALAEVARRCRGPPGERVLSNESCAGWGPAETR